MTQYIPHITQQNERWDSIAWKYYQDLSKIGLLIETNQHVPITVVLPAGLKLFIPLIEQENTIQDLPPWK